MEAVWRHRSVAAFKRLRNPSVALDLAALLFYALLDLYFALYSRSWPLTLLLYVPFCIPLEAAFYLQVRRFLRERSKAPNSMFSEATDPIEATRCWEYIISSSPPTVVIQMIRGWFLGVGEPGTDNIYDLIAMTTFNVPATSLDAQRACRVCAIFERLEARVGQRYARGRNPELHCMACMALDSLEPCYKPLAFYLWLQSLHALASLLLTALGFERRDAGHLKYWHRPPADAQGPSEEVPPLVFMHGVGGLPPYWLLLLFASQQHRGHLFVPIFPHCAICSMPVLASSPRALKPHELATAIRRMLTLTDSPGATHVKAAFLAHSFGTAALAATLKLAPDLALACTIVDPICFWFSGSLAHNFMCAPLSSPPLLPALP